MLNQLFRRLIMSLKAGIVGLPNVGKSTLFNAITKQNILSANYPFATIEPNLGTVFVNDKRLEKLNEIFKPKSLVPTSYEFIDIAGLVKGASDGEGLGNKFLSHIREVDAICEVVRCFDDPNVIHVNSEINPVTDVEVINLELVLSDLAIISTRLSKISKKVKTEKNKTDLLEYDVLLKCEEALKKNVSIRNIDLSEEEKLAIKSYNFLTMKPIIYLANIKEEDINQNNVYVSKLKEYAEKENSNVIEVCVKLEEDLKDLDEKEKEEMLLAVNMKNSALDNLILSTYEILNLGTFFTVGKDEVKAWTYKKGMTAKECAGLIHSDIEKGFIKAEVYNYKDFIDYPDENLLKEKGKIRIEGKDYLIQDGDICFFRFNV
jgi:ferrous iron transport protein B